MRSLDDNIKYLKGVGEKRAEIFAKLDIHTVKDLLYYIPRSYTDYSFPVSINDAVTGENNVIEATVTAKLPPSYIRKGMTIYKIILTDYESDITLVIYNSEYLYNQLEEDKSYCLYGKITGNGTRKEIYSPIIIPSDCENKIQPVYHLTEGISNKVLSNCILNALKYLDENIYEPVPKEILSQESLCSLPFALYNIHFPKDSKSLCDAKARLVFDELLVLQLGMLLLKGRNRSTTPVVMENMPINEFYRSLPFELTDAQKRAIDDCKESMCGQYPMNRLLQGDVGSGKTAVASACCYFAFKNGYQSALMAPTEILANQHYATLTSFLSPLGVKCCLLTGSLSTKEKNKLRHEIENNEYPVVVGTHALVQQSTHFKNLGLVITDEQHRFGVAQRADLALKGSNPHKLVMSATPIPRTLALMIYGDLDISVLDELPKGRQPVETYAVTGKLRERAFSFVKKQLDEKHQAYIVCPAIDENVTELKAVNTYADKIKPYFKGYTISLLHGKMPANEKDRVMEEFKQGKSDILVSTTVIEVGVDVPNATCIVIENSERFGLSQLHQLRGRVGRGNSQSYCILITDNVTEESRARLKVLSSTNDGFKISEEDLKLRGPGDFFGSKQHGLPQLKIADLSDDMEVFKKARKIADDIINKDPHLIRHDNKGLNNLVAELFDKNSENMN